tara:strand:+ start:2195 stop:4123 length:1929 start_codon:yes stop_codon:yes gene_type:complete
MFVFPFFKQPRERKIKEWKNEIEVQEVFLDSLAQKKGEEEFGEQRIEVPLSQTILKTLYFSFLVVGAVFLFQSFQLQVFGAGELRVLAEKNAVRSIPLAPNRGVIYDSSFAQLAFNRPSFDFVCDKRDMPPTPKEKEAILKDAATILGVPFDDMKERFQSPYASRALVAENITHEQLVLLELRAQDFEGCSVAENVKREYVEGPLFSHVLGYTAKISAKEFQEKQGYSVTDSIGKDGVEKAYESVLRGKPGRIVIAKDSTGKTVKEVGEISSVQGKSTVLWLNAQLQERLAVSIQEVFQRTGTKKAAAVALDPSTGGVLALVSLPSFDNNLFAQGISAREWEDLFQNPTAPLFNRAISGIGYPTGSVIKPLVGVAALEEGIITPSTKIFAPLELCVENIYTKEDECFRDWEFHGTSDIARAIAESVNTFFYIIGGGDEGFAGLGPSKIKEYIQKFGWGEQSGIDLPGEGKGILPEFDQNWRLGDTYHFSIGQGPFAVTPLQVATGFAAVANGGTLYEPQTVQRLVDGERNTVEIMTKRVKKEGIASAETLEVVKKGMRQTVAAGSATRWLDTLPVDVAAKTGTAQTGRKTIDGKDYLHSWTVAFAPVENPEIILVVVVEDVKEGQIAALPVVQDVFQWYFTR